MVDKVQERAFLVGSCLKETNRRLISEQLAELARLAETAHVDVIDIITQTLSKPNTTSYIGSGKLREIKKAADRQHVNTLIFNDNLTPSQARNIASVTKCNIVDRTELILEIFANHVQTRAAILQVELAQLEYNYSKLRHQWEHLSRIEGGIGTRGPGEKQLETDRRAIRKRITLLREKLRNVERVTEVKRQRREGIYNIALVGYTNAGKSTIFNRLTKSSVYVADKLFATLDATTRQLRTEHGKLAVLTDTIGFIRHIPHSLIKSFHATLREVESADLLLHIIDISDPAFRENIQSVDSVLQEIGANDIPTIKVFNKRDALKGLGGKFVMKQLANQYRNSVFVSAICDENLDELSEKIENTMNNLLHIIQIRIPDKMTKLIQFIESKGEIVNLDFDEQENEFILHTLLPRCYISSITQQIEQYKLERYINT